ncbi:MAG TPA: monovalent cation/H(+) antiporter subunit G [Tepidisphaeraceae bacterium]|nr:monovalent cation/H(+) antiporter subunit G [Tepidisphaeraceae bacterium]
MEVHHPIVVGVLAGVAVLLAIVCAVGVVVMRDPYQRLHFPSVVVTFSTLLIAIAVWIEEKDPQARIKVTLIGLLLFVMNSVLTAATAKSIRIRQKGHWEPHPDEQIPVAGRKEVAGAFGATEDHQA